MAIKEVYIVHHSHTDVGYTDLQEQVIYNQAHNIRTAVALMKEGIEKGDCRRDLKWNCETWYCVCLLYTSGKKICAEAVPLRAGSE